MPPVNTKNELIKRVEGSRRRFDRKVQHLDPEELLKPGTAGEWSFKDVLAHLADWEERFLGWIEVEKSGQVAHPPEPGYTFSKEDLASVNQRIYEAHHDLSLDQALDYFHSVHEKFMQWLEAASEELLFTEKQVKFTGDSTLATWFLHYARHDDWGSDMINKYHQALHKPDKAGIIQKLKDKRLSLEKAIAKLSPEEMVMPGVVNEWSAKDVLAHLADWQERHMGWQAAQDRGEVPAVPAPGITWKAADVDRLNKMIFENHCHQSLEEVLIYFRTTFESFIARVESVPEEQIFARGGFNFIGNSTPARWFTEYSFHDGWGISKIDKFRKARRKAAVES